VWGQKNGHPWITTVEERWDMDEIFQRQMKENGYTREDMEAMTELGTTISPPQPKSLAWRQEHCEGRYHLTSKYSGGDTIPLKTVAGYREELKRNPGQQKRTWEEEENKQWETRLQALMSHRTKPTQQDVLQRQGASKLSPKNDNQVKAGRKKQ